MRLGSCVDFLHTNPRRSIEQRKERPVAGASGRWSASEYLYEEIEEFWPMRVVGCM